jgi:hypothetical protein
MSEFKAYFDESGCHDGSSVLAVGGYLIRSDRAARMERKWKAALSRYGVPYFHMVDCAHGNGVFQSLSKQQRVEIQTRVIDLIKKHAALGFVTVANPRRFSEVAPIPDIYTFCVNACLMGICAWFSDKPDAKIEFIFESGHKNGRKADRHLMTHRRGSDPDISRVYHSHRFADKATTLLVRDEPLASIVAEALEGYATGRFQTQAEVKRFFEDQPTFPKTGGVVLNQKVTDILTRPIYAGLVECREYGVTLRQGKHEGLVSVETFNKIQDRLNGNAKTPARKDLSTDFPLRGFVLCGDCGKPLTACFSKGRNGLDPYYLCFQRGCASYRKSIRRDLMEEEFGALLKELQPSQELFRAFHAMFKTLWDARLASGAAQTRSLKSELAKIEREVEQFLDRIAETEVSSVITAYENRIRKLEARKLEVAERIANCGRPLKSFDETLRTEMGFLASPWNFLEF